jgi:hypothetical protein
MKIRSILTFVLLFSALSFSQNFYTTTLTAADTVCAAIKLGFREIPAAIYTDSLTASSNVGFYVYFGDTTGTDETDWYRVASSDSTWYGVGLKAKTFTPLNPAVFYGAISDPFMYMNKATQTWLFIVVSTAQTLDKYIKLKVRYY